jgi:hypothetical protein
MTSPRIRAMDEARQVEASSDDEQCPTRIILFPCDIVVLDIAMPGLEATDKDALLISPPSISLYCRPFAGPPSEQG